MARYRGPRLRVMRSLGTQLPGLSAKIWDERRPYPPGMHQGKHRSKPSVYGLQLKEKQKLRFNYGVLEKQFKRYVANSFNAKGDPAQNLVESLETRLDNVVFRSGFARSIPQARQLVRHGHIRVNDKKVNIPSYAVTVGEAITLSKKAESLTTVQYALENPSLLRPDWLEGDMGDKMSKMVAKPSKDSLPLKVELKAVIEFYSR
ncbi:MAG: 30S ribosomal protein S4 [Zetaproteobacteria bacterium]|nr:30S ribosomal protein S4 [Pseudobdellovibrionaceae bacterium]